MNISNLWGDFLITICVYREGEKEKKEERERKIYLSIFTTSRTLNIKTQWNIYLFNAGKKNKNTVEKPNKNLKLSAK